MRGPSGEIGLDYHYDFSPRDVQQAVFRAQMRLARELRLPVVIHTREADSRHDRRPRAPAQGRAGVLHCFTGTAELAQRGARSGVLHLAGRDRDVPEGVGPAGRRARQIPLDRLLIETDSPFLAPVPHRGGRNEPRACVHTAETLAALDGSLGGGDRSRHDGRTFTRCSARDKVVR